MSKEPMMTEVTVQVVEPPVYDTQTYEVAPPADSPATDTPAVESPAPVEPAPESVPAAPVDIEFASGWNDLWATLTEGYPGIGATLTTIGLILVSWSIIKWANAVRKGASHKEGAKPIWSYLLIGSILTAPTLVIPLILTILEVVVSVGISLIDKGIA